MPDFAVLWDLDGTLCDTAELHYQSWVASFGAQGISFEHDFFRRTFGMNNNGVIRLRLGDPAPELIAQISNRKEIIYRQSIPGNIKALPGVHAWLERLSALGTPMAVASSAPRQNIIDTLDELGLNAYFKAIVSVAGRSSKPDPFVFLEAAERLGVLPGRCIVIEDAIAGVEAAKRAGMMCIAVTNTNPAEALQGADLIVEGLDSLGEDAFQKLAAR